MKLPFLAIVALALGCSHARSVDKPDEKQMAEARTPRKAARHAGDVSSSTTPTSPTGLLKPGAVGAIQDKLVVAGELNGERSGELDGPTRAALARYQKDHDLPATGLPDDATVEKLGLKVGDVFKPTGVGAQNP
jgi:hypothetical protein